MKKTQKKNITMNYLKQIYNAFKTYDYAEVGKNGSLTDFSNCLCTNNVINASNALSLYVVGNQMTDKDLFDVAIEKFGSQINHILGANLSSDKSRFDKYYVEFKNRIKE